MAEVKHTPGQWMAAAKPSSVVGWPVVAAPMGQVICDVAIINKKPDHISDGEFSAYYAQVEANARLIAAAPDLFGAANAIAPYLGATDKNDWRGLDDDDAISMPVKIRVGDLRALRAALSKATTQQEGR